MRPVIAGSVTPTQSSSLWTRALRGSGLPRLAWVSSCHVSLNHSIQVDLNVVYRDSTGYDQGGLGLGWSAVPGGKMRYVVMLRALFL